MAINANLVDTEAIISTSTTITLGYSAGQTVPPRVLFCNNASAVSVTLPAIPATLASGTGGNYYPGVVDGFMLTVFNVGAGTVTVSAASGDTVGGTATIAQNVARTWTSLGSTRKWYMTQTNS